MDKQYKEWLQDQTFETLATLAIDNYNIKLLLLAEQAKNKKLIKDFGAKYIEWEKTFLDNKKLVEALESVNKKFPINDKYIFKNDTENICRILFNIRDIIQQALNEVNNAK